MNLGDVINQKLSKFANIAQLFEIDLSVPLIRQCIKKLFFLKFQIGINLFKVKLKSSYKYMGILRYLLEKYV